MKALTTILLLLIGGSVWGQIAQPEPITPDTLVNGKIPVTIFISPDKPFPYESVMFNREVIIMTMNQARALSEFAGKYDKTDTLQTVTEQSDSLCLQQIEDYKEKIKTLEENFDTAILAYEAEKTKNKNLNTAVTTKEALIKVQKKEIRRQKRLKWASIIAGTAVTLLAITPN